MNCPECIIGPLGAGEYDAAPVSNIDGRAGEFDVAAVVVQLGEGEKRVPEV